MELIKDNNLLVLKMDAPGNNLMTGEFLADIVSCLEEAEKYKNDSSVKGFVITCAGRHFSCGADVNSLMERSIEELKEMEETNDLPEIHKKQKHALVMMNDLPFPVISAVKGFSIGSGCEIAANTHIRICESSARIGQPESTFGILPALGGIAKTSEFCGLSDAIEMVLTGNLYSAAEASEKNWCDILCDKNQSFGLACELIDFINANFENYDRLKAAEYVSEFMKIKNTSVKGIKKIGIIGYGKMGQEIFSLFHDSIIDADYTVICRHDAEEYTEKVNKNLAKAHKRGKLSDISFKISSENFRFTSDLSLLSECDLIIETISENPQAKREIFEKLDSEVKESCIFATNTSSVFLPDIFGNVSSHKCMGLHFFYPVKLSGCIEFNGCTDKKIAEAICSALKKEPVFFENDYCFYLNQFISYTVSCAMIVRDKYKITTEKMMEILSDVFPQHSLFGMVDSIGLSLLSSGNTEKNAERIRVVLDNAKNKYLGLLENGCSGETGCYLKYVSENEETDNIECDASHITELIISAVLNEAVNASEECGTDLTAILADTIGLSESAGEYFNRLGYSAFCSRLNELLSELESDAFRPADEETMIKYY